jgi:hypothetical protein
MLVLHRYLAHIRQFVLHRSYGADSNHFEYKIRIKNAPIRAFCTEIAGTGPVPNRLYSNGANYF